MEKKIAILEGDGIGPEITDEGLKILTEIEKKFGHHFERVYAPFGASAYFNEGHPFPEKTKQVCDEADAIIKGPVGLAIDKMKTIPQELRPEIGAILPLRKRYNTYANYRPVRLPAELADFSPLKKSVIGSGINILMIRELVGGIYFGDKVEGHATEMKYASDDCVYTADQVRAIATTALSEARKGKCLLTNVHKSNVLATSRFWSDVVEEVAKQDFPDVELRSILVDNAAFQLVLNPIQFNGIMLLENMQGDILTDQAGGVLGSLGLMPSACIGPLKGYVEPAHGSAPDIAGKNIANPYSMIGSVALMLEKCFQLEAEAECIWQALFTVFGRGFRTADLKCNETPQEKLLTTDAFGDMVVDCIKNI